jgi:hypothetical protein
MVENTVGEKCFQFLIRTPKGYMSMKRSRKKL